MPTEAQFQNFVNRMLNQTSSDFKRDFEIQEKVTTPDGQGGFTVSWQTFAYATGFIRTAWRGDEDLVDQHIDTDQMWEFGAKYIAGVDTSMRIAYDGKIYNIKAVNPVGTSDFWLRILAEEERAT